MRRQRNSGGRRTKASETLPGEGAAGMGFEIFFEFQRSVFVREGAVPDQFPGLEFRGVRGLAGIVFREPSLQIRSCADVFLVRKIDAADDVDVPHGHSRMAASSPCVSSPSSPKRATPGT